MKTTIYNDQGQPFSRWRPAEKFGYVLMKALWGLDYPKGPNTPPVSSFEDSYWCGVRNEYQFDPERKWRFDTAFPKVKVAVEIDGTLGRHSTPSGEAKDNEKLNRALELGWKVFRYNSAQLGSKQKVTDAVEQVVAFICNAKVVEAE